MKKIIAASVASVALAAALPLAASAGADHDGRDGKRGDAAHHGMMDRHGGMDRHRMMRHHHKGGERGERARFRMLDMIELYDTDGDGSITQAEIDQYRADRLDEFDADGDGRLSIAEYEQLWLDALRERMVDRFQSYDNDGDGQVTVEEFSERTKRKVMRRDRNGDEMLSLDDLRRDREAMDRRGDRPQRSESASPAATDTEGEP